MSHSNTKTSNPYGYADAANAAAWEDAEYAFLNPGDAEAKAKARASANHASEARRLADAKHTDNLK